MPRQRQVWMYSPPKPAKPKVPEALRAEVERRARDLFARLEYIGGNRFSIAYMRHTGQ